MFIVLKSGELINLFWLQDCKTDTENPKVLIYYLVNGLQLTEEYDTESEAKAQQQKVDAQLKNATYGSKPIVVSELPTDNISESATYLVPDPNATDDDYYIEYRYVNGKWEPQGVTKSAVQKVEDELTDFQTETEKNFEETNTQIETNKEAQDEVNETLQGNIDTVNSTLTKSIEETNQTIVDKLTWDEY